MAFHFNKDLLDDDDLEQFYRFTNKIQKKYTQANKNSEKIDLFIVLDISGSMNKTCNYFFNAINTACGFYGQSSGVLKVGSANFQIGDSRLKEAKKHLIIQIKQLIKQKRVNKLGLITFNHQAQIAHPLTDSFDQIISQIQRQHAHGKTALYDSLKYAANQLKDSKNPRILIMTDGQDTCSKQRNLEWAREWFKKDGLKSTFFTICQGDTEQNRKLAEKLHSEYIKLGQQAFLSNSFDDSSMVEGIKHLK